MTISASSPVTRPAPALLHIIPLLSLCLLTACGPEVKGSPTPPKEFGAMRGALLGCPAMQGQYAWPPVAGDYSQGIPTNARPWEGGRPVPVGAGNMQVWVQQTDTLVTIRSRAANAMSVRSSLPYQWRSTVEYGMAQFSCKSDILHFEEVELPVERKDAAGTGVRQAFALARLKDGGLAVGIKTTVTGRTGSVFGWGGQSYGSYRMADAVYWSWSKLASLDPVSK